MDNKEKIENLLSDIKALKEIVSGMHDVEVYPVSFFNQTFRLAHKILNDIHQLESDQLEALLPLKAQQQPVIPEAVSVHEVLEKQHLPDLRKAFSLNDHFYFRRELFNGDEARMNKVISDLNEIQSYKESVVYLNEKLAWNIEDATVDEFMKLLEKRFL